MKMRVLFACGSAKTEAAVTELQRAGLGNSVEAIILSLAEFWLPAQLLRAYEPPRLKSVGEYVAHGSTKVRSLIKEGSA